MTSNMQDVGYRAKIDGYNTFMNQARGIERQMLQVGQAAQTSAASSRSAGDMFGGFLGKFAKVGLAVMAVRELGNAITSLAGNILDASASWEGYQVQFETFLGSPDAAQSKLKELSDFARRTPFELPQVVDASRQLLAYGFSAESIIPMLERVGDAAAGLGSDALPRIIRALGQMQARTKVSSQEMLQLTETGIPAWQMLADGMGITVAELQSMVEKGIVPADQAIQVLLNGMQARFGGLMQRQSQTFNGMLSNLGDWTYRAKTIFSERLFEGVKEQLRGLLNVLDTPEVEANLKAWGEAAGNTFSLLMRLGGAAADGAGRVGTAWSRLSAQLQPVVDTIAGIVARIGSGLQGLGEQAAGPLGQFTGTVVGALESLAQVGLRTMEGLWNRLVEGWLSIEPLIAPAIDNIGRLLGQIGQGAEVVLNQVEKFMRQHGDEILAIVESTWGATSTLIKVSMDTALSIVRGILKVLSGDWQGGWEEVKQIPERAWDTILQGARHAGLALLRAVRLGMAAVGEGMETAWYGIRDATLRALHDMVEGLKRKLNEGIDAVEGFVGNVSALLVKIGQQPIEINLPRLTGTEFEAPERGQFGLRAWLDEQIANLESGLREEADRQTWTVQGLQDWWAGLWQEQTNAASGYQDDLRRVNDELARLQGSQYAVGPAAQSGMGVAAGATRALQRQVQALEAALREAQAAMRGFADPRLAGMQAWEDQMFELEMAQKRARLEELGLGDAARQANQEVTDSFDVLEAQRREIYEGIPVALQRAEHDAEEARRRALMAERDVAEQEGQTESERLALQREALQLQYDLTYASQLRQLKEMYETLTGANDEVTFEEAMAGLLGAHQASESLTVELEKAKTELELEQDAAAAIASTRSGQIASESAITSAYNEQYELLLKQKKAYEEMILLQPSLPGRPIGTGTPPAGGRPTNPLTGMAEGGTTLTAGAVKVGERGAEVAVLPRGTTVIPHNALQAVTVNRSYNDTFNIFDQKNPFDAWHVIQRNLRFQQMTQGR